jgi:hypothetical protein
MAKNVWPTNDYAWRKKKHRRMFSVSHELVEKSREAALAAVQIFNNP